MTESEAIKLAETLGITLSHRNGRAMATVHKGGGIDVTFSEPDSGEDDGALCRSIERAAAYMAIHS